MVIGKSFNDKPFIDFIQPFLIDHSAIRGRLVRLEKTLNTILKKHRYPLAVSQLLAEQMVLASLLSATLEKDGILTVQVKGDGPVRFMVVDVMAGGIMRGYADINHEALAQIADIHSPSLAQVLGKGYLAVTLDQGGETERYQSIVALTGQTLQETFEGYFSQSQQAEITVHLTVRAPDKHSKKWAAGGIIIERMPIMGGKESKSTLAEQEELWQRTRLFMQTLKDAEMLDSAVTPQNLLYRLFNEDGVWVYRLQPLKAGCRCSRARVKRALATIAKAELMQMLEEGKMSVHCQFCNKKEVFTGEDLSRLYDKPAKRGKAK